MKLEISQTVKEALRQKTPILALESTIITHGLPYPQNYETALELEEIARSHSVTPATIAILEGKAHIGLTKNELKELSLDGEKKHKFSAYDLPIAFGLGLTGSTTVAGTSFLAEKAGIKVFATGGLGGVHKENLSRMDISNDIKSLSETSLVVVSSGAKCILDLESTVEALETFGIPTLGWKTNIFPAFYYNDSGINLNYRVENGEEVARIAQELNKSALLVFNPVPREAEIPKIYIETLIEEAHNEAKKTGITGKAVTPFLLNFMKQKSEGRTVETNCSLIRSNVRVACEISQSISKL